MEYKLTPSHRFLVNLGFGSHVPLLGQFNRSGGLKHGTKRELPAQGTACGCFPQQGQKQLMSSESTLHAASTMTDPSSKLMV